MVEAGMPLLSASSPIFILVLDLEVDFKLRIAYRAIFGANTMLFTPLTLPNGAIVPNRLAKAAMEKTMADAGQLPGPSIHRLYRRWAEGGTGLLITGNVMVDRRALTGPGTIALEAGTPLE